MNVKKYLFTTVLVSSLVFSGAASASNTEWYGKEWQDQTPATMDNALSKLPPQKADDFRATMKEVQDENKDLEDQVRKLHGDLHAILTAPDFDKDAFISKRKEIQELTDKMEVNRTKAFASAVSELSQPERVTLTRALHHGKKHHHLLGGLFHSKEHTQTQDDNIPNDEQGAGTPDASIKH